MDTATLTLVLILAVASIVMVPAMVQFSMAAVSMPERPTAFKLWGLLYLAAWAAIVFVVLRFATLSKATWLQAIASATLVAGGWATFQAFWIWLWLSLAPAKEKMRRRAGWLAAGGLIAVALALVELGYARKLVETMIAPGHRALAATITVTAVGWLLLMVGAIRLVLARGRPMSRAEIDEQLGQGKFDRQGGSAASLRFSRSGYKHFGPAIGSQAEEELSITSMTRFWRSGEWRRDPKLLAIFIMTAGGLTMLYGAFSIAIVAAPLFAKVLCGGVLAFTTFKLIDAIRRA